MTALAEYLAQVDGLDDGGPDLRIGSICTGYGGLDMAAHAVFGGDLAWVADISPGASAILAHRYPDVPNLGDIKQADWEIVEPVDIMTGGFPCQPVSGAGRRKGIDDERWLFDDIVTAIGRMVARPRVLLLENVAGLLTANGGDAMARVIQGLASLGYVGRYWIVSASDAGAPHHRKRVFILAWLAEDTDRAARDQWRLAAPRQTESRWPRSDAGRRDRALAADAERERRAGRPAGDSRTPDQPGEGSRSAAAGCGSSSPADLDWGIYEFAIRRWERVIGRAAPHPTEPGRTGRRLAPRFVEWMMGLPDLWVIGVPGLSRKDQLHALGNGVVPQQGKIAAELLAPPWLMAELCHRRPVLAVAR